MSWMWSYARPPAPPGAPAAPEGAQDERPRDVVDVFIASYVSWREQSAEVRSAYERWASADEDRAAAYAIYCAELEFEEDAARSHQESAARLTLASDPAAVGAPI